VETANDNVESVTEALKTKERNFYVISSSYVKALQTMTNSINHWYGTTDLQIKDAK